MTKLFIIIVLLALTACSHKQGAGKNITNCKTANISPDQCKKLTRSIPFPGKLP